MGETKQKHEIEGFDALQELSLDMRWSWNHAADEVWRQLDPQLWDLTHNPCVVLQTISYSRLEETLSKPAFREKLELLIQERREAASAPAWFQENHLDEKLRCAAYFSMEFMLSESLPIYSGGLGNVAGDQLKAASDLGVPVIGVGLLYQQGYFRQVIDRSGSQQALFPYNDPGQMPISPVRNAEGDLLRFQIDLPGYPVWLRAWQVEVGRVRLFLLDTNDIANVPAHRGITSELYGDGPELRILQEIVLGIGGWRLLRMLGTEPEVCHLNEGHAALAVLERSRSYMEDSGQPFEVALEVTRAGNLFTTHTALAAAFDRFPPEVMGQYLGSYAEQQLRIRFEDLMALGRGNPSDRAEPFNMAYLATRGSGAVNAVSKLHGMVSRRLFAPLFPRWPEAEIPVGHVTNGVHMPSWDSAEADDLWTEACGKGRWKATSETLEEDMRKVSDEGFWRLRSKSLESLVEYTRERLSNQLAASGFPPNAVEGSKHVLDPNALTLGFARRITSYKRPNLLLHDPQRLARILTNAQKPVQLIIAGKAHPGDWEGQNLIREWTAFVRSPEIRRHAVFLADYDMLLTERLVQGVDVWINTPRRPWEACGTSGMKVLVNGGINFSELDGWWTEAYSSDVGWALGDGREHDTDPQWDTVEATELYDLLESQLIPEFYSRDSNGVPTRWITRMRESMARLTPQFSADRAVRQYTTDHYIPGAALYRERAANDSAKGREIVDWRKNLRAGWDTIGFGEVKVDGRNYQVSVSLGDLKPECVRVELYADPVTADDPPTRIEMRPQGSSYSAQVPDGRDPNEFTARIVPRFEGVSVPLEAGEIRWQR